MPDAQNKYQSFRLACDRCRSHKLRCPQNKPLTNPGACERCLRAKVQCTFSPRAPTGRPPENKLLKGAKEQPISRQKRRKPTPKAKFADTKSCFSREDTPDTDLHDPSSSASRHELGVDSMATTDVAKPMWGEHSNFQLPPATSQIGTADLGNSKFNLDGMVDFINGTEMSAFFMPDSLVHDNTPASLHGTQLGTTPVPWDLRHDMAFLANAPEISHTGMRSTSVSDGPNIEASSSSESSRYDGDDCARKLSALTLAFRRHLSMVNHGLQNKDDPQQDHQKYLKNYPLGDIIQLSQELINVLTCLSFNPSFHPDSEQTSSGVRQIHQLQAHGRDSIQDPTCRPEMTYQSKPSALQMSSAADTYQPGVLGSTQSSLQADVDTPTALLILNCHVSLIQIYTTVFARLHQHLDSLPSIGAPGAILPRLPGLQFGELPPSDDAFTRAYASYRILLDTLARSEEILNLPHEFRCVQVRENGRMRLQLDRSRCPSSMSTELDESSESCSSGDSGNQSGGGGTKVPLLDMKLVEAVWRHEAGSNGAQDGDSGLNLLRTNIRQVKRTLRRKMAL